MGSEMCIRDSSITTNVDNLYNSTENTVNDDVRIGIDVDVRRSSNSSSMVNMRSTSSFPAAFIGPARSGGALNSAIINNPLRWSAIAGQTTSSITSDATDNVIISGLALELQPFSLILPSNWSSTDTFFLTIQVDITTGASSGTFGAIEDAVSYTHLTLPKTPYV